VGAAVVLRELTRRFASAERPALLDFSLTVEAGETVCLVGPSGCGKSTTLRLIAGLDRPDAGSVTIDGRDMSGVPPQSRDVAMVFQGFALYPHLTVRRNIGFPLEMRRIPKAERERLVTETAEMLGIEALLERRPAELSGGERQRVAMGRAIVRRPKVFLFDEPLSNLDAALRAELRVELGRLLRRLEATAVYVTHDQAEAMTLGHRIALLREGRIVEIGTPRALYEKPATTFGASFFGAPPMNLVSLQRDGDWVRFGKLSLPAPEGALGRVVLGIRPEDVRLVDREADAVEAIVVSTEPHGAETHVEVEANGKRLVARVRGFAEFTIGSQAFATFDAEDVHWYDAGSERAL
jgi:multiple sugar transport system ATP-binding protein